MSEFKKNKKKKRKIVIIGPIYPWRGGIAHSTYILAKNLNKNHVVKMISFYKQFPTILYPGKDQKEKINKEKKLEFNIEYLLNPLNPISWIKTLFRINKIKPNIIIFEWWHTFFTFCYIFIAIVSKKIIKPNAKITCYCQNVLPHEESKLHFILTKLFFRTQDYFICLSSDDIQVLKKVYPDANYDLLIEPTYNSFFSKKPLDKSKAKKILDINENKKTILCFGTVRKYKGIEYLIEAFPKIIKELGDVKLYIVGEWWIDKKQYLKRINNLKLIDSIEIIDKYISDEEVRTYFSASDLMILPYTSATQSGVLQLGYAYNLPLIATNVGSFKDLVLLEKTGFLVSPKDSKAISKYCIKYFREGLYSKFSRNILEIKRCMFDWSSDKENIILKPILDSENNNE